MGDMLRSDLMTLCDVYLQPEAAYDILINLGEIGCVEFHDMNAGLQTFQRVYIAEICRCAEMERKLRYLEDEMLKEDIPVPILKGIPRALLPHEQGPLENLLEKWEKDIRETSVNQVNLRKNYLELTELHYVLDTIGPLIGAADVRRDSWAKKGGMDLDPAGRLVIITGVVQRQRSFSFETMLWRISRGNVFYQTADEDTILKDPFTGADVRKIAFLAVGQGEQMRSRMDKVCTGFRVNLYNCPMVNKERHLLMKKLNISLKDLESVLKTTKRHRVKALRTVAKQWPTWLIQVKKSKAIYHTMNLFNLDITKKCLIGKCWIPTSDLPRVNYLLEFISEELGSSVHSWVAKVETDETPPTFHRTNKFTNGFQALINAYGDSCYRELNPGLYTIITFPFLFSLMFGDVGHGFIMFLFATWMLFNEKKFMEDNSDNEIWNIFFGGRYIIFLMSIFSMFAGFTYNDIFSKGLNIQGSAWSYVPYTYGELSSEESLILEVKDYGTVYALGVDPAWKLGENKILFENSLKMKLSIIIGVIHMIFGLSLSLFNHLYFKKRYLIFLEFIPQMLFLCCIFLWLVILVFMKWFQYGGVTDIETESTGCAPLILILFIDMVLMSTSKPVGPECNAYMFEGQQIAQMSLVFIALSAVPVMLFGPPLVASHINKKKRLQLLEERQKYVKQGEDDPKEEWFERQLEKVSDPFSDLMIHQAVHTIEFVLSTISHTASYLRLWALSLAHAQLSEMLWMMVFSKLALQDTSGVGGVKIVVVFAIWAVFTMSILVLMEGLSAFLHTLRLHWVEFMSKFYGGCGYPFKPFSFKTILSDPAKDKAEVCVASKRKMDY